MQTHIWHQFLAGLCLLLPLCLPGPAVGATITLTPVADTSLMESFPTNNLGGASELLSGTGENLLHHRALLKFDLVGALPAHARIISNRLVLELTWVPQNGFAVADYALHRLLAPWGEGDKTSPTNCTSCVGQGALATTNEATWLDRFALTANPWTVPGGDPTNDYAMAISSSQTIYDEGNSPYTFASTTQMVADVQLWLGQPQSNFGWMLLTADESVAFSARRFASRTDTSRAPQLIIDYLLPPHIDSAEKNGDQFKLSFTAEAGQTYAVQYSDVPAPTNAWNTLTIISAPPETTNLVITNFTTDSERFYRLSTQ